MLPLRDQPQPARDHSVDEPLRQEVGQRILDRLGRHRVCVLGFGADSAVFTASPILSGRSPLWLTDRV